MLAAPIKKPIKNQLCFEFAKDDNDGRQVKKKSVRQALKAKSVAADGVNDLRDLCVLLHGIAKKHVSPSNFHDFQLVARCTKLLQTVGISVAAPAEMQATVCDQETTLVTSAPEYRLLRSRAIAGLATVADLADRMPSKGSADYQRGMREAYQHASDIAALFLDDLEQFQSRVKKPW